MTLRLLMLFRFIALAAVFAAAAFAFLDYFAFSRAWHAFFKFVGDPRVGRYGYDIAIDSLTVLTPWMFIAAAHIITIRRKIFAMDVCRALALLAAYISIDWDWREIQFWWPQAQGSYGEPLPQGDFDGGFVLLLSYPLSLLTVIIYGCYRPPLKRLIGAGALLQLRCLLRRKNE